MDAKLRKQLIDSGVKNLKTFGYPDCAPDNIMTDQIYSAFFLSILKDNIGKYGPKVDDELSMLILEIRANNAKRDEVSK